MVTNHFSEGSVENQKNSGGKSTVFRRELLYESLCPSVCLSISNSNYCSNISCTILLSQSVVNILYKFQMANIHKFKKKNPFQATYISILFQIKPIFLWVVTPKIRHDICFS